MKVDGPPLHYISKEGSSFHVASFCSWESWLLRLDALMVPRWLLKAQFRKISIVMVVQTLSRVWLYAIPWTAAYQASMSFTISWNLLKLMSIESVMPSNHLILCRPLLLPPSIFPSIRIFSNGSSHQVAKVLEYLLLQNYQKFLKGGDWGVVFWVQKFSVDRWKVFWRWAA